jgi:hypothetical protein
MLTPFQLPSAIPSERGVIQSFSKIKSIAIAFTCIFFAGCTAHSDLNRKSGAGVTGGFKDQMFADGVYFIETVSGMAPWKNSRGAHDTFTRRAIELCGDERFSVLFLYEETGSPTGMRAHKTTTVVGYIRDHDSSLTAEDAKRVVNEKRAVLGLYEITQWNPQKEGN